MPSTSSAVSSSSSRCAADDAGCIERGIRRSRLARQRAGVGDRGGPRLLAAADLDDHDRLADSGALSARAGEPLRSAEAFEEQDDRRGLGVIDAVGQIVADVEDDFDPQLMIRLKPTREPDCTNASVTEPDWAMPATPPRGEYGDTSPMYVALFTVRSMTPMQLGPTRASPWRRAILATSACIAAAASAFDHAAARDDDRRDASVSSSLGHIGGPQRVERDQCDVGLLRRASSDG